MTKTFEIVTKQTVTEEDLDNIVDAAVNYCSYWCDLLSYGTEPTSEVDAMSQALSHGGTLVFSDSEKPVNGQRDYELTQDKLLKALSEDKDFDLEDYDGPMADAVVQRALFGEVIYG